MKVWANYRNGGYSGGMILVASNTAEEAHEAFHKDENYSHMFTVWNELNGVYVSDEYYYRDGWELMPILEANVNKPQVIAEAGYTE